MSKPNHTKSQLPMIRSLKAIARRKMNGEIEISPAVRKQVEENHKKWEEQINAQRARYIRKAPASLLRALVLHTELGYVHGPKEMSSLQLQQVRQFKSDMAAIASGTRNGPVSLSEWKIAERARYQELFQKLENTELQVIAGESVDLAPYTHQLKS